MEEHVRHCHDDVHVLRQRNQNEEDAYGEHMGPVRGHCEGVRNSVLGYCISQRLPKLARVLLRLDYE